MTKPDHVAWDDAFVAIDSCSLSKVHGGDDEGGGGGGGAVCTEANPSGAPGMGSPHSFEKDNSSPYTAEQRTWQSVHDNTQPVYDGVDRFNKLNRPAGALFRK